MDLSGVSEKKLSEEDGVLAVVDSHVFALPLSNDQNLINFKALLAQRFVDGQKVGVVRSRTGVGRAAQSVASVVIPGNQSVVRHPVRSTIYSALTPGPGGGRNERNVIGPSIGRKPELLRCPSGFEFGGRFATRGFGNCGRRLFDIPGGAGGEGGGGRGTSVLGVLRRQGSRLGSPESESRAVQIQRNAQIPRVGGANESRFNQSLDASVTALANPDTSGSLLVRRDGQILRPTVSPNVLTKISDNPDMKGGALVVSVNNPSSIGQEETPVIWKSGIKKVVYALPGGGSISVAANGNLTPGQKRSLSRAWAKSSNTSDGEFDYGLRLRRFTEEANGKIEYSENFPNIDGFNDTIEIERESDNRTASVKRWVFSTYLAENAVGRDKKVRPWKEISKSTDDPSIDASNIKTVDDAVAHLNGNGAPEEVPADLLNAALNASDTFKTTKLRDGVSLVEGPGGKRWYRVTPKKSFTHLAEKISSDVNAALGLQSLPVKFIGTGDRRDYLIAHPQNAVTGEVNRRTVGRMNPEDLLRVNVGDWLNDNRDRKPDSLIALDSGPRSRVIPTSNQNSALAGLSLEELRERRNLVLGDFLSQSLNAAAAERYESLAAQQRKVLVELYNNLLERASNFNWDDYTSRLGLDGELSAGEKSHLELVKKLFERRLRQLRSSRQRFLSSMRIA